MEIGALIALFTAFNLWGIYGCIPYTIVNPTRTFLDRAVGSLQLTASIYSLCVIRDYVDATFPTVDGDDDMPFVAGGGASAQQPHPTIFDTMNSGAQSSGSPEASSTGTTAGERFLLLGDRKRWYRSTMAGGDGLLMAVIGLLWVFIFGNAVAEKRARKDQPQDLVGSSSPDISPLQGLGDLLEPLIQKMMEPAEKVREIMDDSVAAFYAAASRNEGLLPSSIGSSVGSLTGVLKEIQQQNQARERERERSPGFHAGTEPIKVYLESIPTDFSRLVESLGTAVTTAVRSVFVENSSYGSTGLELQRRENSDLKRDIQVLRDRFDDLIEGRVDMRLPRSIASKFDAVETLHSESLGGLERELNTLKIATTSVSQSNGKIEADVLSMKASFERRQNDTEARLVSLGNLDAASFITRVDKVEMDLFAIKRSSEKLGKDVEDVETRLSARIDSLENADPAHIFQPDEKTKEVILDVKKRMDKLESEASGRMNSLDNKISASVSNLEKKMETALNNVKKDFVKLQTDIYARLNSSEDPDPDDDKSLKGIDRRVTLLENVLTEYADDETVQELKKDVLNLKDGLTAQGSSLEKVAEEMWDHIETRISSLQGTTLSPSIYEPVKTTVEDVRSLQEDLRNVRSELDNLSKEDLKKINSQLSNVSKNIAQLQVHMDQKFKKAVSKETVAHIQNNVSNFAKLLGNLQKAMDTRSNETVSKGRIDEIETQFSDLKKEFVSLRGDVDTQRNSLKDMQPGSTGYQLGKKSEADHSNLEMDFRKMQKDMEEQQKNFASKETVEGLSTRLSEMEERLVELPHDAKEQLNKMASTETTVNKLSTKFSNLEKQVSQVPSDLEQRLDSMDSTAETVKKLSGKISKLEDGLKKVPSDAVERLESLNRVTSDMEERINSLASADTVKSLATNFAKVEKHLHKIPDDLDDRLDNKASADTVDALSKNFDAFKSEWNEDRKKLNGRLDTFIENLSRADDEIKSAKSSIVELSTSVKSVNGVEGVQTGGIEQKQLKNLEITVEVLQKDHKILKTQFTENKIIWDEQIDKVKHLPEFVSGLKRVLNKTSQDTQLCIDRLKLQSVGLKNFFGSSDTSTDNRKPDPSPTGETSDDKGKGKSPESGNKTAETPEEEEEEEKSGPSLSESRWATSEPYPRSASSPDFPSPSYNAKKKRGGRK
ncbi:hypothetical protein VTN00DRAFT_2141 [Thermoascus crustaceus]|uniref:uncharacterized protein n=1 Tax=Thermoascus crustaceus TaxID=5088 RepID=UPI00374390F7